VFLSAICSAIAWLAEAEFADAGDVALAAFCAYDITDADAINAQVMIIFFIFMDFNGFELKTKLLQLL